VMLSAGSQIFEHKTARQRGALKKRSASKRLVPHRPVTARLLPQPAIGGDQPLLQSAAFLKKIGENVAAANAPLKQLIV
jgi:hypothetical protein